MQQCWLCSIGGSLASEQLARDLDVIEVTIEKSPLGAINLNSLLYIDGCDPWRGYRATINPPIDVGVSHIVSVGPTFLHSLLLVNHPANITRKTEN